MRTMVGPLFPIRSEGGRAARSATFSRAMPPILQRLSLSLTQRQELELWLRTPSIPDAVRVRALIVLAAAKGRSDSAIASELKINRKTVHLWRRRFTSEGLAVLWEVAPGRGRKALYGPQRIQSLVEIARPAVAC